MSYDPLPDVESIDDLIEEYGMDDYADPSNPTEVMQVELLEAINQIGPQVMDDTKKRNALWSIIRSLAILQEKDTNTNSFTIQDLPAKEGRPSTQTERHSKILLQTENSEIESIIH
jgi:hypothetical protein